MTWPCRVPQCELAHRDQSLGGVGIFSVGNVMQLKSAETGSGFIMHCSTHYLLLLQMAAIWVHWNPPTNYKGALFSHNSKSWYPECSIRILTTKLNCVARIWDQFPLKIFVTFAVSDNFSRPERYFCLWIKIKWSFGPCSILSSNTVTCNVEDLTVFESFLLPNSQYFIFHVSELFRLNLGGGAAQTPLK